MTKVRFSIKMLHPRYWLVWVGMLLLWFCVQVMPYRLLMWLGAKLGRLAALLSARRSLVARKNIALCFPDLDEQEQEALFWKTMESTGKGLFDTGISWFMPRWRLDKLIEVKGIERLLEAHQDGHGVLLFSYHFTSLELGGVVVNRDYPHANHSVYRPHANAAFDYVMRKGRERHRHDAKVLPRGDVRGMVKILRSGEMLNYLPDQDYGHRYSTFVPFFGVEAATITAPSQLVKVGRAKVFSICAYRKKDGSGYLVEVYPAFEGYGQGDLEADAQQMNAFLEARIREYPDQYLWVHRRFKSRPDQQEDFYSLAHLPSFKRRAKRRRKRALAEEKPPS